VPPNQPPALPPAQEIERLIGVGDAPAAWRVADELVRKSRHSLAGWLGRARAAAMLGRIAEADADAEQALKLAPQDPQARLVASMLDQRLGRTDRAAERLRRLSAERTPYANEAAVMLAEVLWFAHRRDELRELLAKGGDWMRDPRAALMTARMKSKEEPAAAIDELVAILGRERNPLLRRAAGFEAVGLLDKSARYREAYDLALRVHADTTPPFDLEGHLMPVRMHREMLEKRIAPPAPRVDPVQGVALVVGLPRSGTTLLEQMLDRHPAISGIGEYDGIETIFGDLLATGRWPRGAAAIPRDDLVRIQRRYLDGAQRLRREGASWSFDKTLRAWRMLPAVGAILPGAVCLHVARDPRDMAISILLSHFHPYNDGWTASLASIRRAIEAERAILPAMLAHVGLPHESLVYEDLVADPAGHVERCLSRMGLSMDARCLSPEENARAVFTLSHEQVRRPINSSSIGRWRNYEFAFDEAWKPLVEAHDKRRTR